MEVYKQGNRGVVLGEGVYLERRIVNWERPASPKSPKLYPTIVFFSIKNSFLFRFG